MALIPLRDSVRSRTFPIVTLSLIAANVALFVFEFSLGPGVEAFLMTHGFVPARLTGAFAGEAPLVEGVLPLLTSMFLHGGLMHLLGNMWYLWIFGDNVEDRFGHLSYLVFYVACGVAAGLAHALAEPRADLPAVGASGAIAGVLGAYLVLYPHGRVLTLVPFFVFFTTVQVPALFFLVFWFLVQWISGAASLTDPSAAGGVAWWAHIGGFIAGALVGVLARLLPRRPPLPPARGR